MHILHVVDHYHPKVGYQETLLARTHARMGHRVTVVTSDRNFPFPNYDQVYRSLLGPRVMGPGEESSDGVRILRLRARLDMRGFVLMPALVRTLRREAPDLVIHHGLLHPNFILTALASRSAKWALVADSHMAHYNTNPDTPAARWFLRMYRLLLGRFVRRRVRTIAIGPSEQAFLGRVMPGLDAQVIPLGADGSRFQRVESTREAKRAELGIAPDEIVLFHSGKFLETKKTLEVIQAFAAVSRALPRLRLLLVGGGEAGYEARLRAACAGLDGVRWLPLAPNEELPALMMCADVGVWPGAPSNSFIEAMAMGLPLVLERTEYGEFLLRANNGRLVSSPEELASTLAEMARDPEGLRAMGRAGQDLFQREFSDQRMAERFLEVAAQ